jgi:hypothetical protein
MIPVSPKIISIEGSLVFGADVDIMAPNQLDEFRTLDIMKFYYISASAKESLSVRMLFARLVSSCRSFIPEF